MNRLLEISKRILGGFKRHGDMIVSLETVTEFQDAIVEADAIEQAGKDLPLLNVVALLPEAHFAAKEFTQLKQAILAAIDDLEDVPGRAEPPSLMVLRAALGVFGIQEIAGGSNEPR